MRLYANVASTRGRDSRSEMTAGAEARWGKGASGGAGGYLVPEHTDGAGGGHLIRTEPHRRGSGRHPEDEDLRQRAAELSQEGDGEQVGSDAGHLDPRAGTVERRGRERDDPEPLLVQQPGDREDERDVGQHVDHGHPVYGEGLHAVELHEDVVDDAVLDPLVRVTQRVGAEQQDDEPAAPVQPRGQRGTGAGIPGRRLRCAAVRSAPLLVRFFLRRPVHGQWRVSSGSAFMEINLQGAKARRNVPVSLTFTGERKSANFPLRLLEAVTSDKNVHSPPMTPPPYSSPQTETFPESPRTFSSSGAPTCARASGRRDPPPGAEIAASDL